MGKAIRNILITAFAGLLLYLALRGLDLRAFTAALTGMDMRWLGVAVGLQFLAFLARSLRWNMLLSPRAGSHPAIAFFGEMVGYVGNAVLPARAGEALRAVMVSRRLGIDLPFTLGTIAVERVADAVMVSGFAAIAMLWVSEIPAWLMAAPAAFGGSGIGILLVLAFLAPLDHAVFPHLRRLAHGAKLVDKMGAILDGIALGAHVLIDRPVRVVPYVGVTVLSWAVLSLLMVTMAHAFGHNLNTAQGLLFAAGLALSSGLPSTPGYLGVFQYVAVTVLEPWGFTQSEAVALIVVYQAMTVVHQLAWASLGWIALNGHRAEEVPAE
jgi:uncharacterized protein (TIRG00374 family)